MRNLQALRKSMNKNAAADAAARLTPEAEYAQDLLNIGYLERKDGRRYQQAA